MPESVNEITEFGFADVGEVKLHYAKVGSGQKLVVLLHGFPEFWYSWSAQLHAFSEEYTVVAPDMRGYNLSDKPLGKSHYLAEKLSDDVVGLIEFLGFEKAFVAGHDWGAGVAWTMAARSPEKIEKLVCMQVPPGEVWKKNQTFAQLMSSWYMFFFQLPWLPEMLLKAGDFARPAHSLYSTTAEKGVFTREDIEKYKESWRKEGAITAALNYYRANIIGRLFSRSAAADPITIPTMFIYGQKDHAILPQTVRDVGSVINADFREVLIPNAGHWVQREASVEVTEALTDFFK